MKFLRSFFTKLWKEEKGQSTVEYVVILLVIVGLVVFLGGPLKDKAKELIDSVFGKITGKLDSAE
jgi:Flp pilus assembly pilin Flp